MEVIELRPEDLPPELQQLIANKVAEASGPWAQECHAAKTEFDRRLRVERCRFVRHTLDRSAAVGRLRPEHAQFFRDRLELFERICIAEDHAHVTDSLVQAYGAIYRLDSAAIDQACASDPSVAVEFQKGGARSVHDVAVPPAAEPEAQPGKLTTATAKSGLRVRVKELDPIVSAGAAKDFPAHRVEPRRAGALGVLHTRAYPHNQSDRFAWLVATDDAHVVVHHLNELELA